jgi:tRNA 5-methylaminomethyl-2-thiouridine biosynthesis bifunctional protein
VEAGFTIERMPGYGRKREMLTARYPKQNTAFAEPWFAPPEPISNRRAVIIGGGIAGVSAAQALRRRGFATTIVDRQNTLAAEASGNPLAIAMPRLTAGPALDGAFYAQAWPFAQRLWTTLGAQDFGRRCGVLQLAIDSADDARQAVIAESGVLPESMLRAVSAADAGEIAGCAVSMSALHFPQGSTIAPRVFCAGMAQGVEIILGADVVALERGDDGWHLRGHNGEIARADVVVLANAGGVRTFAPGLPLQGRRGQTTAAPPTRVSAHLRCVLSYGGAVTPVFGGAHYLGATFDHARGDGTDAEVRAEDHRRNLAELARVVPDLLADVDASALSGRAAVRWATPDHLALAGPVPDEAAYRADYAGLHHGRHWLRYPRARTVPGLFVLSGLGAHGLVAAPLAAEVLACAITGEPSPLPQALTHALHPARFLIRALKRK